MAAERAAEDMASAARGAALVARAQAAEAKAEVAVGVAQRAAISANSALMERLDPDRATAARNRAIDTFRRERALQERMRAEEEERSGALERDARARVAHGIATVQRAKEMLGSNDSSARSEAFIAASDATRAAASACSRWANAVEDSNIEVRPCCEPTYENRRILMVAREDFVERSAREFTRLRAEAVEAERAWRRASDEVGRARNVRHLAELRVDQLGATPENVAALEQARTAEAAVAADFPANVARFTGGRDRFMVFNNALVDFGERTQTMVYER
jgi:hypothetical protein